MSITVRNLFSDANVRHQARLVAGDSGLGNLVDWFNAVEDKENCRFLRGHEVIFTTGLLVQNDDYLDDFVHSIHEAEASALVIYFGPHIKKIPASVISYCNKIGLPLYTIPWEVYLIDITRDFGEKIFASSKQEESVTSLVLDLIFGTGDPSSLVNQFERYGFRPKYAWTFIGISLGLDSDEKKQREKERLVIHSGEYLAKKTHDLFVTFPYRKKIFFLLVGYSDVEITSYAQKLWAEISRFYFSEDIHIGIGENVVGLSEQRTNFERAFRISCLCRRRKKNLLFYSDLYIDWLLVCVKEESVLVQYYEATLKPLREYDNANHSDLFHFLKVFLDCDGSPQAVSEKLFIHRNTVNKYMKKVLRILNISEMTLEMKSRFLLAYSVCDFLDI